MKSHFEDVALFMETFGQEVNTSITDPGLDTIKLRLKLIIEEFGELVDAVTIVKKPRCHAPSNMLKLTLENATYWITQLTEEDIDLDYVEIADALTDTEYVTLGAGHAFGLNLDATFAEVQASNMSKLGADGKPLYREDGKVLKGAGYFKPAIKQVLVNAGCYDKSK